jgi:hypothetical protein
MSRTPLRQTPVKRNAIDPCTSVLPGMTLSRGVPSGASRRILAGEVCTMPRLPSENRKRSRGRRISPGPSPSRPTLRRKRPSGEKT